MSEPLPSKVFVVTDQRGSDRRNHGDRRKREIRVAIERRDSAERRGTTDRREEPAAEWIPAQPPDEAIIFMKAMDQYKWANRRPFPTWSEVLEVVSSLGYRKTEASSTPPTPQSAPAKPAEVVEASELEIEEQRGKDRRNPNDRRKRQIPVATERRSGFDRRIERRRQVDPTTCEKEYSDEEIIFMKAMDHYKRANRRPFPTWSEVLEILVCLGYRKTEGATSLPGNSPQPFPVAD